MPKRALVLGAKGPARNNIVRGLVPVDEKVQVIIMDKYTNYKAMVMAAASEIEQDTKVLVVDGLDVEKGKNGHDLAALYTLVAVVGIEFPQLRLIVYASATFDIFRCLEAYEPRARFVFEHVYIAKTAENEMYLWAYQSFVKTRMEDLCKQITRCFERGLENMVLRIEDSGPFLTVFNVFEVHRLFRMLP